MTTSDARAYLVHLDEPGVIVVEHRERGALAGAPARVAL